MSFEQKMINEDLARDAADQKQAAHETEVMAEYKELFTGEDGDIREILREMADSEEGVFERLMLLQQGGAKSCAAFEIFNIFDKFCMEYVERNMRDGE